MPRPTTTFGRAGVGGLCVGLVLWGLGAAQAPQTPAPPPIGPTDKPVVEQDFATVRARDVAAKPEVMQRQRTLLDARYDLSNRPADGVMMSGGRKAVQQAVRVKLQAGLIWEQLAAMAPDEAPKILDQWWPWLAVTGLLIRLACGPVLAQLLSTTALNAPGYRVW